MNYKMIFSDLDETLLNDDHLVPENNIYWIQKARQEKGVKFVPATGRGYRQIIPELTQLGLNDLPDEYSLSFNGACLSENKDLKVISWHGLAYDVMKSIFDFGLAQDVCIHIYSNDILYIFNLNQDEKERLENQKLDYVLLEKPDVSFMKNERIAKILYENTDVSYMMGLEPQMTAITKDKVAVSYSSNRYMEFNTLGVDKGAALKDLAEKLAVPIEQTIAIGDNYNDMAMLNAAGLSVAAANAVDDVKEACDYTTCADNNEGAVAEAIRKFIYHEDI